MSENNKQVTAQEKFQQRLISFKEALKSFEEAYLEYSKNSQKNVNKMALIQGFEFSFELSWKTLKYFLEHKGVIQTQFARDVIKQAFNESIIKEGQLWIDMLEDRNKVAHVYDADMAKDVIQNIFTKYFKEIKNLYQILKKEI